MKPTRASYSAISTYDDCAAQYAFSYVQGLPWPSGVAATRGKRLHTASEMAIDKQIGLELLPREFKPFMQDYANMLQAGAISEEIWCTSREWGWVPFNDPATLMKAIIDLHWVDGKVLEIIDVKSGRIYPEHVEQLQLYATMGMSLYPAVDKCRVRGMYLDEAKYDSEAVYPRTMLPFLQKFWTNKADRMLNDTEFLTTEGVHCNRCPYRKSLGGPCPANR